jgi:pimeloyl-ACP methyl ester carboxylesterase
MLKLIARGLLGLLVIVVVAAVAAFGYRAWRQHEGEKALAISSPNGIDEAMFVPINGTEQWIAIRGQDRRKPVLVIVSGGPGFSTYPAMTRFLLYEKDYVVVHWDQPGTAKTFARDGSKLAPGLKIEDYVTDGIAVTEYLKAHLHKDKVIVLGWSWGSIVGIEMVRARPDLFSAYVGTG